MTVIIVRLLCQVLLFQGEVWLTINAMNKGFKMVK